MAYGYRTLQHWNQWLSQQPLGHSLLEAEEQILATLLDKHYGKHAVLVGVPKQHELLKSIHLPCQSLVTSFMSKEKELHCIEADFHELPLLTGSIDLVVLPHTLEFVDNPRQLLAEACRIIKPEGLIVICGFNPYSTWGMRKLLAKKHVPWAGNFIQSHKIKSWLRLVDFELEKQRSTMFRPPVKQTGVYQKMHFLESLGKCLPVLGGVYILVARAKVVPLTPIRLKWKQQLRSFRLPTTITGHIARQIK